MNSRLELVSFLDTSITSNRADIDHAIAELNKSTALLGQLHFREVAQTEVCQFLVFLLPEPLDKAVAGKRFAQAIGN